jgi:cyclophilin family peptidyl-prolyl cis-trans isomerase
MPGLCCSLLADALLLLLLQGGDPTGTGLGGESIYGPTFKDELDSRLLHRYGSQVTVVFSQFSQITRSCLQFAHNHAQLQGRCCVSRPVAF